MKVKCWALCFVMLLSCEFMLRISSAQRSGPVPQSLPKRIEGDLGSTTDDCIVEPNLVLKLDQAFNTIQNNVPYNLQFNNLTLESNFVVSGFAIGFKSFRVTGPYGCACGNGSFAYIVVNVNILQLVLSCTGTLLADLSSGLLGPLGTRIAMLYEGEVNPTISSLGYNIDVRISIFQEFIPGSKASVSSFFLVGILDGAFLDLRSYLLGNALEPETVPVSNVILEFILNGQIRDIFKKELENIVLTEKDFVCNENDRAEIEFDD